MVSIMSSTRRRRPASISVTSLARRRSTGSPYVRIANAAIRARVPSLTWHGHQPLLRRRPGDRVRAAGPVPRPPRPHGRAAHRSRRVQRRPGGPGHPAAVARSPAPSPDGRPARPRVRLRAHRRGARPALARRDRVGGRRERPGARPRRRERPPRGRCQCPRGGAGGSAGGGQVRRHLLQPARPHRQAGSARPPLLVGAARGRHVAGRVEAPRRRFAGVVDGRRTGLVGRPPRQPGVLPRDRGAPVTARPLSPTDLKRLHRGWRRRTEARVALVLDGVMTPVNVGSIVRLAAAYGASPVWLAGSTAPASHPGARKTAMGTGRFVEVVEGLAAGQAIASAREEGFRVVGIELASGAVPLHELALAGDVCMVVGNEDHGLSAGALSACDDLAYLPLVGKVGSLNVATAAAIALYEVRRREWASPAGSEEP